MKKVVRRGSAGETVLCGNDKTRDADQDQQRRKDGEGDEVDALLNDDSRFLGLYLLYGMTQLIIPRDDKPRVSCRSGKRPL